MATVSEKLNIVLTASTGAFTKGLGRATKRISGFVSGAGSVAKKLATVSIGAIAAGAAIGGVLVKQQMSAIDANAKAAASLGMTTEALTRLQLAGEQTGVSNEQLRTGLQRMSRSISEAAAGTGQYADTMKELGIDAKTLKGLAPEQQFSVLADAIKDVQSPADKVRMTMDIFGRSGADLVNTLNAGSGGLAQFAAQSDKLGNTLSNSGAKGVEAANDAVNRMKNAFSGIWQSITIAIAPIMVTIANIVTAGIAKMRDIFGAIINWVQPIAQRIYNVISKYWEATVKSTLAYNLSLWGIVKAVLSAIWSIVTSIFPGITKVGAGSFGTLLKITNKLRDGLTFAFNMIEFAIINWRDVAVLALKQYALSFVRTFGQVKYTLTTVIPTLLSWFADNWREIFITVGANTLTFMENLASNIVSIIKNIPALIKGEVDFSDLWTPLSDGFVNVIKEMPDIPKREMGQIEQALTNDVNSMSNKLGSAWLEFRAQKDKEAQAMTDSFMGLGDKISQNNKKWDINVPKVSVETPEIESDSIAQAQQQQGIGLMRAGSAAAERYAYEQARSMSRQDNTPKQQLQEQKRATGYLRNIAEYFTSGDSTALEVVGIG